MSDSQSILNQLFPAVPVGTRKHVVSPGVNGVAADEKIRASGKHGKRTADDLKTSWAAIYTLELRGIPQKQIAEALNLAPSTVSNIVTDPRYLEYRERHLAALDQEFVAMKPLAFAALKGGLSSSDENTALRASEQWFKGAGYGGFSKTERASTGLTAEDVARALLGGVNVQINTQVNVNKDGNE